MTLIFKVVDEQSAPNNEPPVQPVKRSAANALSPLGATSAKKTADIHYMPNSGFTPRRNLPRSPSQQESVMPEIAKQASSSYAQPVAFNVATANTFEILANKDTNENSAHTASDGSKLLRKRKKNIPPFVFTSAAEFKSGLDVVYKYAKDNHYIKYLRVGTKIQVETMEAYLAIDKELTSSNAKYFTHDFIVEKPNKFVLNGLPYMDAIEVESELKAKGLEPTNIHCVPVKQPRFDKEYIYIISLPNTVYLNDVQKIKAINHTIVKWFIHKNKTKGPTQCRKCFLYGHGIRNCHLQTVCVKCGHADHSGESCEVLADKFKCSNCNGNHLANDPNCKSRTDFVEMRKKLSAANNKTEPKKTREFARSNAMFPALPIPKNSNFGESGPKITYPARSIPASSSPVDGNWIFKNKATFAPTRPSNFRDALRNSAPEEDTLFSTSEILQITKDVLHGLAACKSKQQQLEVIFEICSTYLNGP